VLHPHRLRPYSKHSSSLKRLDRDKHSSLLQCYNTGPTLTGIDGREKVGADEDIGNVQSRLNDGGHLRSIS
jgi:hypothetical protein